MVARYAQGFGLRGNSSAFRFLRDPLGLGLRGSPCAFRARFTLRTRLALARQLLLLDFLNGNDSRIFRHLNGLSRHGPDRLTTRLSLQIAFGVFEPNHGLLEG